MDWTLELPTKEGIYLFQKRGEWPIYYYTVEQGSWKMAQDPGLLYTKDGPVVDLKGLWYGPIRKPEMIDHYPNKNNLQ